MVSEPECNASKLKIWIYVVVAFRKGVFRRFQEVF